MIPATEKKNSAVPMYRIPSRLWSTVVSQSCSFEGTDTPSVSPRPTGICVVAAISFSPLFQRSEVRYDLVKFARIELHIRHQIPVFDGLRVFHPGVQIIERVRQDAGAQ